MSRRSVTRPAHSLHVHALALLLGLCLGAAVQAMAQLHPGDAFRATMAVVLVGSASASFVFYMRGSAPSLPGSSLVRGWIVAIGGGLLFALLGAPALLA
jgi:hypothetical protein